MTDEKTTVRIEIDKDSCFYISDLLCWLNGYLAAKEEHQPLLAPAVEKTRRVNEQLKKVLLPAFYGEEDPAFDIPDNEARTRKARKQ